MRYFRQLSSARLVLWCYFIWYLFFALRYFEASRTLWGTSLGLSGIIGVALLLSTSGSGTRLASWTTFRLFLMPFCVSSFSALVKGRGFFLVFSPHRAENFIALGLVIVFAGWGLLLKCMRRARAPEDGASASRRT